MQITFLTQMDWLIRLILAGIFRICDWLRKK
ncbi:hypothetical protein ICE98_03028 [Lactococcus lactis]|nr:hypothetical protein [Lactococcus lactis]